MDTPLKLLMMLEDISKRLELMELALKELQGKVLTLETFGQENRQTFVGLESIRSMLEEEKNVREPCPQTRF